MSDIWIDPVELRTSAALLGQQAQRIQDAATGVTDCCGVGVPPSMAGWIDEALTAVTEDALRVAVAYVTQAVDLAQRANEVVTEEAADTTTGTAQGVDPATAIIAGGAVVGGTGPAFTTDLPAEGIGIVSTVGGNGPQWTSDLGPEGIGLTSTLGPTIDGPFETMMKMLTMQITSGSPDVANDHMRTLLQDPGLHVTDGHLEDEGGNRGGIVRPDPYRPGAYEID